MIALIAVVALFAAGVGQAQNRTLRHRVARVETTHRTLTRQQAQQAEYDIDTLVRLVGDRDCPDLVDVAGVDVVDAAEDLLRRGPGGDAS